MSQQICFSVILLGCSESGISAYIVECEYCLLEKDPGTMLTCFTCLLVCCPFIHPSDGCCLKFHMKVRVQTQPQSSAWGAGGDSVSYSRTLQQDRYFLTLRLYPEIVAELKQVCLLSQRCEQHITQHKLTPVNVSHITAYKINDCP